MSVITSRKPPSWLPYTLLLFILGAAYTSVWRAAFRQASGTLPAPSLHSVDAQGAGMKQRSQGMLSSRRTIPMLEMVSGANVDEPRIFIVHDLLSNAECEHLISLALKRGLQKSLITPYGSHDLVESTTRTNKQAWLDFGQDDIVRGIEARIAKLTKTSPEQGENLQVLKR